MASMFVKSALAAAALVVFSAAQAADVVTKQVDLGTLGVPSATNYGTVFTGSPAGYTSPGITALGVTLTSGDTFYEDYAFVVPTSTVVSLASTVSLADFLNISGLQARLYQGTIDTVITGAAGPALVVGWGQSFSAGASTVDTSLIAPTRLGAGDYVLQIRGTVGGQAGGSYVGALNVSSVPEPASAALLAAGLAGLAGRRRQRPQG